MINKKEIFTASNFISLIRLFLVVPLWIMLEEIDQPGMRLKIFLLGVITASTDFLDGYLARRFNQVTECGKVIDPLADKVCVGGVIFKLFLIGKIPTYYFYMIIGRDILLLIGGVALTKKLGKVLPSNPLGKITVSVIAVVILLIIADVDTTSYFYNTIYYSSIILIFASFAGYMIRAMEILKEKNS